MAAAAGRVTGGETVAEGGRRADGVVRTARAAGGDVALFAHGHVLRLLAARWLGLPADHGRLFALATASISVLRWEREGAVIERWNESAAP